MTIRPATPDDVPAILVLERACHTAAHWSEAEYKLVFDSGATPRLLLVAEESDIVGFVMVRTLGPEWEIENVAVAHEFRSRGIGARLVATVLQQAKMRAAESLILEVRASNAAARALYTRAAFAEVGRRPAYYSHPTEDAILYRLHLRDRLSPAP